MDILLVISKFLPEYTGAGHRVDKLYQSLPSAFNVSVLCGGIEYKDADTYKHNSITVERMHDRSSGEKNRWRRLFLFYCDFFSTRRTLRRKKFDILHIVGSSAQTCAALYYASHHNIPAVIELVTGGAHPLQPLPLLGKILKPSLPERAVLVAISEPLALRCEDYGYKNICWARPNPVDEGRFRPEPNLKSDLRRKIFPFNESDIIISMIAKFMPQKNQIFLLDVMAALPKNFKLALGGPVVSKGPLAARDAAYIEQIIHRIKSLKLEDRVFLHQGFIQEPQEWMQASDIYALPNRDEGLGTPMLEAQACGLRIIANKNEAAFQRWIQQDETGYLVPLDPGSWAAAIKQSLSMSALKLQERADYIRHQYGMERTTQVYRDIFTCLAGESDGRTVEEVLHAHS